MHRHDTCPLEDTYDTIIYLEVKKTHEFSKMLNGTK